jgi:hypothetical protein
MQSAESVVKYHFSARWGAGQAVWIVHATPTLDQQQRAGPSELKLQPIRA